MKTSTKVLVEAMKVLSVEIHSGDGVANAAIAEAAERLEEQDSQIEHLQELLNQSQLPEIVELLGSVIAVSVSMGQEIQDFIDAGEESGSDMKAPKELLAEWNDLYKSARVYE